jgi:hypothetical protein
VLAPTGCGWRCPEWFLLNSFLLFSKKGKIKSFSEKKNENPKATLPHSAGTERCDARGLYARRLVLKVSFPGQFVSLHLE